MLRWMIAALCALCLAWPATAQQFPQPLSTTVNDFAALLEPERAARLTDRLAALERETGIQMTVVTMRTKADHWPGVRLEDFATALFNTWGIGDAARNDGILVLVLPQDREMRIELGQAYGRDWDAVAQSVIDDEFLPGFRGGDYAAGIEAGSLATIRQIAEARFQGAAPPPPASTGPDGWIALVFAAVLLPWLVIPTIIFRHRLRRCPSCGRRGLRKSVQTIVAATKRAGGQGDKVIACPDCQWQERTPFLIPSHDEARTSSGSSGSSFGGGSSGGGGASGRW